MELATGVGMDTDPTTGEQGRELDFLPPAEESDRPGAPFLPLGQRVRRRGLQALKAEAYYAVAALVLGHEIAACVLAERQAEAVEAGDAPDYFERLAERAGEWAEDGALLRGLLAQLRAIGVPSEPVATYLGLSPEEVAVAAAISDHVEAQVHRALVQEQLEQVVSRGLWARRELRQGRAVAFLGRRSPIWEAVEALQPPQRLICPLTGDAIDVGRDSAPASIPCTSADSSHPNAYNYLVGCLQQKDG